MCLEGNGEKGTRGMEIEKKMKEVKGRRRKDVADIEIGDRNRMHKGGKDSPDVGKTETIRM
jgi:hypothetical protein